MSGIGSIQDALSKDYAFMSAASGNESDGDGHSPQKKRQQLVWYLSEDQLALITVLKHDLGQMMDKNSSKSFKKLDANMSSVVKVTDESIEAIKSNIELQNQELINLKNEFRNKLETAKQAMQSFFFWNVYEK